MINKSIVAAVFAVAVLSGCDRDAGRFENKLFFDASDFKNEVRVAVDENVTEMSRLVTVSMARPEDHDIEISFVESPELLDTYREAYYDPETELLPEGHCDLSLLQTVIKAGEVTSAPVTFEFTDLGADALDYDKSYVLPVTVQAEGMDALPRARTMYFLVRQAALVNMAADFTSNFAWPEWGGFTEVSDMSEFTMEALVCGQDFSNGSKIHTIMGIEDCFLIRAGDLGIEPNQIQVAFAYKNPETNSIMRGSVTSPDMLLGTDTWHHIAVTFSSGDIKAYLDGKMMAEGKCSVKDTKGNVTDITSIDFAVEHSDEADNKPRCFWVGYSYDDGRPFNGMMTEIRVWKKALTGEEINSDSHFYKIYPDAGTGQFPEELVAYWKFTDEKGSTVKDWSMYGHDLTADHDFVWCQIDLP